MRRPMPKSKRGSRPAYLARKASEFEAVTVPPRSRAETASAGWEGGTKSAPPGTGLEPGPETGGGVRKRAPPATALKPEPKTWGEASKPRAAKSPAQQPSKQPSRKVSTSAPQSRVAPDDPNATSQASGGRSGRT